VLELIELWKQCVHAGSVLVIDRLGNFHCVNGSMERAREGERGGGEKMKKSIVEGCVERREGAGWSRYMHLRGLMFEEPFNGTQKGCAV